MQYRDQCFLKTKLVSSLIKYLLLSTNCYYDLHFVRQVIVSLCRFDTPCIEYKSRTA